MFKSDKRDWRILVLTAVGLVFFCLYSFLAFNSNGILNSPDETSNHFFAERFARETSLQFYDPANDVALGLVSPRSMRVIAGKTVPAGFIGLPLVYGLTAKILTPAAIPYLTPFLSVIGIIFFYLLIKLIFEKQTAFFSSLLAFILPGWWYYSAKGLMPNVAFVSFLVMALYFFLKALKAGKLTHYLLFSVFLSFSLMVRTSEFIWVAIALLAIALHSLKKINWRYLITACFVFLFVFLPVLHFNQLNYGSPFSLGYTLSLELEDKNLLGQSLTLAEKMVLPFGFHPKTALANFYDYTFKLFPAWSNFILFGFLFFVIFHLVRRKSLNLNESSNKKLLLYSVLFFLISLYLVIYYGSWNFHDHPDPDAVTIGTSYIRYWLPIYLFSLPFFGFAFSYHQKKYKLITPVFFCLIWLVLFISSWGIVMNDQEEGIFKVKNNLIEYQEIASGVSSLTAPGSIIIADRMDKVFFPRRSVIFRLNTQSDYVKIKELVEAGWPVYWFNSTMSESELASLNNRQFEPFGLKLGQSLISFNTQSLYPVNTK